MRNIVSILFAVSLFFLLCALPYRSQAAFGISPPFLNADHLVKGATYVQRVYLVQDQPNEDLRIKANLKIDDAIRSWINIDKGFDFVIPKGVRQFPVEVTIKVPVDTTLGAYNGNLSFVGAPSQTGQVTIALGAQVVINLTVGNDIYRNFSIALVKPTDIEEGWSPRAYIKARNDGNVPESLDGATFELYDQFNSVRLAYIQKTNDFPQASPFSVKEYTIEFPTDFHLGLGQYWGTVTLYQNQKIIATQKTVFNVLKAGSLSGPLSSALFYLKNNIFYTAGAVLVLIALVGMVLVKRRHRLP